MVDSIKASKYCKIYHFRSHGLRVLPCLVSKNSFLFAKVTFGEIHNWSRLEVEVGPCYGVSSTSGASDGLHCQGVCASSFPTEINYIPVA